LALSISIKLNTHERSKSDLRAEFLIGVNILADQFVYLCSDRSANMLAGVDCFDLSSPGLYCSSGCLDRWADIAAGGVR
jgi:hypothetical protein